MALPGAKYQVEAVPRFYQQLVQREEQVAGVRHAAVSSIVPFGGDWDRIVVDTSGGVTPMNQWPEGDRYIVSPSYFSTMGIRLLRGRLFTETDRVGQPLVAVVDEVFARKVQRAGTPLGVRITVPGNDSAATIVGVVGHVKHYGLDATSGGQIYVSHLQYPWRWMSLMVKTEREPLQLAAAIRATLRELDRDQPVFDVTTVEALMDQSTATRRFVIALLSAFAVIALVMASIGLYGVIAYGVAQRRREFGIRLALGARPSDLVRGVLREASLLTGTGLLIGAVLALLGGRLLASLLFQVRPVDPVGLIAIAVLAVTAGLAALIPASRVARVDPNTALRGE
jgi:putative ABC transport system permease protein